MVDLPESATWHPLKAARWYEVLAEEACGIAVNAFTSYPQLRQEFRDNEKRMDPTKSIHAIDAAWGQVGEARKCVSDLATYSNLAQMYSAMATMKYTRFTAEQEYRKTGSPLDDLD